MWHIFITLGLESQPGVPTGYQNGCMRETGDSDVILRHMDGDFKMAAVSALTNETINDENELENTVDNSSER